MSPEKVNLRSKTMKYSQTSLYFLLFVYLIVNTGIVSDDFVLINCCKEKSFYDHIFSICAGYEITIPVLKVTHGLWYNIVLLDRIIIYDFMKIFYICLAFYCLQKFFNAYHSDQAGKILSFFILFYPTHESTVYWYLNQYLTLTMAFYLYAFYLATTNRLLLSFFFAFSASFISYGSTPFAIALAFLFIFQKNFLKAMVLLAPNVIFIAYYIFMTRVMGVGVQRIPSKLHVVSYIKQLVLQFITFLDAIIGPSFWFKIYYALLELSLPSIVIGVAVIILFYKSYEKWDEHYDKKLLITFSILTLLSLIMFAVTGYYPQLAFNLGNRTTIYGSLLLVYLIFLLPLHKKIKTVIFAILIFAILGISDHWKNWNKHQQQIMQNIKANPQLVYYNDGKPIYVSGNQYSKLGKISHIEFFSESFVVSSVFKLSLGDKIQAVTINKRFRYADGYLIDTKYNDKFIVDEYINIYDSERNILFKLKGEDINNYIASLPPDNRHWVQLIDNKFFKELAVKLMPRLKYAL